MESNETKYSVFEDMYRYTMNILILYIIAIIHCNLPFLTYNNTMTMTNGV